MVLIVSIATASVEKLNVGAAAGQCGQLRQKFTGFRARQSQPEQFFDLAGEDDDGDTGGKPDGHRIGDKFDIGAEPHIAGGQHEDTRQRRRQKQAIQPVAVHSRRYEHDEGACWSTDLETAAAESGYQEAADNRGEEAAFGGDARSNGNRHGKRQGHDRHRKPGDRVAAKLRPAIPLAKHGDEFGCEQIPERWGRKLC